MQKSASENPINKKRSRAHVNDSTARKVPRRRTPENEDEPTSTDPSAAYPGLEAQFKHIPPSVVSSKWVNLSSTSQEQVRELLRAVERPVIAKYTDDKKRAMAQAAIGSFIESVERKLPRFPFPPNTPDAHFDYEKLLDANVRGSCSSMEQAGWLTGRL